MSQDITAIDLFCGAGGSSTGLVKAGVRVRTAVNHWRLAIDTHATNHPTTDHDCADIRQVHPSFYPKTDIFWASPECTNHSLAKGKKRKAIDQMDLWGETQVDPSEERSRATMREVVEFAEYHRHSIVVVENVVDIRHWAHFESWLTAMVNLGYEYKILYLNAQFFNVPQSRDRIYIVFWRKGNKAPKLDFRPAANCPKHGAVFGLQAWKKQANRWGRYKRQYVYVCPQCGTEVFPVHVPAGAVIDWSLPSPKIGDRKAPLKPKTIQRIKVGLKKYARRAMFVDMAYDGGAHPVEEPLGTQTTRQTFALLEPFMAVLKNSWSPDGTYTLPPLSLDDPLSTVVASASQHALITPPWMLFMQGDVPTISLDDPLHTLVAQGSQHALIVPPFLMETGGVWERDSTPLNAPLPTQTTRWTQSLISTPGLIVTDEPVEVDVDAGLPECGFRMLEPHELKRGMSFPDSYVILGNKRDQVRQVGNAVCPNVAEWIIARCVESLS